MKGVAVFLIILIISLSFGKVVFWEDKAIRVEVPENSVLTVELPCHVLSTANLPLVDVKFSTKRKVSSVHIAVGKTPTSVGITCETKGVVKSYNIFIVPSKKGTTFLKIVDRKTEEEIRRSGAEVKGRKVKSVISQAERLMRSMLLGRPLPGYKVSSEGETIRRGRFEFKPLYVYSGPLTGVVYKIKNISPMRVEVHPSIFAGKGVVLVWLEGTERSDTIEMKPGEERFLAIVKVGKVKESELKREVVVPWR